jgi:SAM-dependent methyltransferase
MKPTINLKDLVRGKYAEIAKAATTDACCCGCVSCEPSADYTVFSDDYTNQPGYVADADLGLGCGLPTDYANIKAGHHVLDLGCGAGNDCFVARSLAGDTGKVTGLDFTDEMLAKANKNVQTLGYTNVDFVKGDIEAMPLPDHSYDVVISNCVLNLVPDKDKAFAEIHRVLRPGGHFCISDVVIEGQLPEGLQASAEMYAGCVSGALPSEEYLGIITKTGFTSIEVPKRKEIVLPDEILLKFISQADVDRYRASGAGIYSITVTATK